MQALAGSGLAMTRTGTMPAIGMGTGAASNTTINGTRNTTGTAAAGTTTKIMAIMTTAITATAIVTETATAGYLMTNRLLLSGLGIPMIAAVQPARFL